MKKFKFISIIALALPMIASAQFKMIENGHIAVGSEYIYDYGNNPGASDVPDTLSMIKIYGPLGQNRSGGRITFGDSPFLAAPNVAIGEYGVTNSDKIWLQGINGFMITAGFCQELVTGTMAQVDVSVPLRAPSFVVVTPPSGEVDDEIDNPAEPEDVTELTPRPMSNGGDGFGMAYGFIAQEVEALFPELVVTDSEGRQGIDYLSFIPLLVGKMKDMKQQIEKLEYIVAQGMETPKKSPAGADLTNGYECVLYQNVPNPFNESTTISYTLAEGVTQADLYIYDLQGTQKMHYPLSTRSSGTVNIEGSQLQAGMYICTLIVDSQVIDTKRMIFTK